MGSQKEAVKSRLRFHEPRGCDVKDSASWSSGQVSSRGSGPAGQVQRGEGRALPSRRPRAKPTGFGAQEWCHHGALSVSLQCSLSMDPPNLWPNHCPGMFSRPGSASAWLSMAIPHLEADHRTIWIPCGHRPCSHSAGRWSWWLIPPSSTPRGPPKQVLGINGTRLPVKALVT